MPRTHSRHSCIVSRLIIHSDTELENPPTILRKYATFTAFVRGDVLNGFVLFRLNDTGPCSQMRGMGGGGG